MYPFLNTSLNQFKGNELVMLLFYMYIVYLLSNPAGHTYIGSTNNPERRLRQHNGEICGGAKATKGKGPWSYEAWLTCEEKCLDHPFILSLEWHCKHPFGRNKKCFGIIPRLQSWKQVINHQKFVTHRFICFTNRKELFSDERVVFKDL